MRVTLAIGDLFFLATKRKQTIMINVYMAFVYHLALALPHTLSQGTLNTACAFTSIKMFSNVHFFFIQEMRGKKIFLFYLFV